MVNSGIELGFSSLAIPTNSFWDTKTKKEQHTKTDTDNVCEKSQRCLAYNNHLLIARTSGIGERREGQYRVTSSVERNTMAWQTQVEDDGAVIFIGAIAFIPAVTTWGGQSCRILNWVLNIQTYLLGFVFLVLHASGTSLALPYLLSLELQSRNPLATQKTHELRTANWLSHKTELHSLCVGTSHQAGEHV